MFISFRVAYRQKKTRITCVIRLRNNVVGIVNIVNLYGKSNKFQETLNDLIEIYRSKCPHLITKR